MQSMLFFVYFVIAGVTITWLFYQGFSPNSKLNMPEPEKKNKADTANKQQEGSS
ncbi:hypothetical protein [Domibacillus robiginosus]|uniref:hypothetical protein n=1 Tax=Domibacillus robiginosus TaxID=1071054 RepID=UPI0012E094FE|nr:hypothetical protein [Domibacillus robiginosus]